MAERRERLEQRVAILIIALHFLLAVGFSLGPILEGPDETEHYRYIRTLVNTRSLPNPAGQPQGQYHQAPLYYFLMTPFALLAEDTDFEDIIERKNLFHGYDFSRSGNDNKNIYFHSRTESFPYDDSQTARTVHLLRLLSVAMGTGTLFITYHILRILWPNCIEHRLLALSVVAFWPQFTYVSSVITNDNLLYLLTTLSLWLLLRQRGEDPSWLKAMLLGAVLAAALLTKASAAVLVLPVGLAVITDRRQWRYAVVTLVITVLGAGWWYVRNWIAFGDPTGINAMFETWQTEIIRPGEVALDVGIVRAWFSYETFWARFGAGSVAVSDSLYVYFDVMSLLAMGGLVIALIIAARQRRQLWSLRPLLICGAFAVVWIPAVIYSASIAYSGNQGRYLIPGATGWGVLLAIGIMTWVPRRFRLRFALSLSAIMASVLTLILAGYFQPAYHALPPPDAIARPLSIRYGDYAELIGMSPAELSVRPGETVTFELYWRALGPSETMLYSYLHSAFAPSLVWRDSVPGNGNLLATEWQPGQTWTERYVVEIPLDAPLGTSHLLVAGLYDQVRGVEVSGADERGNDLGLAPVVGTLVIEKQ
jgi:hypothetical protein